MVFLCLLLFLPATLYTYALGGAAERPGGVRAATTFAGAAARPGGVRAGILSVVPPLRVATTYQARRRYAPRSLTTTYATSNPSGPMNPARWSRTAIVACALTPSDSNHANA